MSEPVASVALQETAAAMVAGHRGLLAMDESISTCNKRFASVGIAQTEDMRRAYRELLITTPALAECINGVILVDETLRQMSTDGTPLAQIARNAGMLVGIKVDTGAKALAGHPGEHVTEGLDGLRERLQDYFRLGARFAKWRGVIAPAPAGRWPERPSSACIEANAHALARYAALCQEAGLVPIIEPEVLMDGDHTLARCAEVTEQVLHSVFEQLVCQGVMLEAVILKPNMVVAGLGCADQNTAEEVAAATVLCLLRTVPGAVPGIAFLSGGQTAVDASCRLNAMHTMFGPSSTAVPSNRRHPLPWPLSFSFARALQHPALDIWAGQ
ncbi:MAG: fructose-bisphosphate aldolase class I, partial [Gammaproteobacteria bacterium]|nr:fructose-bisphosphate aldolase class I [Gammaproteobacteria bacterium]